MDSALSAAMLTRTNRTTTPIIAAINAGKTQRGAPRNARRTSCQHKRSEEHTSELQSLMRISYAVFCLKKKKKAKQDIHNCTYIHTAKTERSQTIPTAPHPQHRYELQS